MRCKRVRLIIIKVHIAYHCKEEKAVLNSSWFASSRDRLCHGLELGHGWRVMRVMGQLIDGSRESRVTKCDHCQLCFFHRDTRRHRNLWERQSM